MALMMGGDASEALSVLDPPPLEESDVWINTFSFVDRGHYIFVALVCCQFKTLCLAFLCQKLPAANYFPISRQAVLTNTSYRAKFSSVPCAKHWHKMVNGRVNEANVCWIAALAGSTHVLKWVHQKDFSWDLKTCQAAAENGHFKVLKCAHTNGCPWDLWTCYKAAKNGHVECLKYAHENGCSWDERTCTIAVENGHLEVVECAYKKGFPWDEDTSAMAAFYGHFEVLKHSHEKECPRDNRPAKFAAKNGKLEP